LAGNDCSKVKDWPVKKIAAFPSQLALTLPGQENHAAALIENRDGVLALTIRQSELQAWASIWLRQSAIAQSPC
jgi:hypothetical protein